MSYPPANKGKFRPINLNKQAVVLIKPDALEDDCVPAILKLLSKAGLGLDSLIHMEMNFEDGLFLYENNIKNAKNPELRQFKIMGAQNLKGHCLIAIVSVKSRTKKNPWDVARKLKGFNHTSEKETIRGLLCHNIPENLEQYEVYRLAARNRIHLPKDDEELKVFIKLLRKKGLNL